MFKTSKKVLSCFLVMISTFCCLFVFSGCKKKKTETIEIVPLSVEMITLEYNSVPYDKSEKTPTVTIKNGETIIESTEYSVAYENNKNIGTAKVIVSATEGSKYLSGSAEKSFQITIGQIGDISEMKSVGYNGESQAPLVLIDNLHNGTDFTFSWKYKELGADDSTYVELDKSVNNFKEVGCYQVTVVGKGDFEGTKTATFIIYNSLPEIVPVSDTVYDGTSQVPEIVLEDVILNQDYLLKYEYRQNESMPFKLLNTESNNFVNAGEYKITAVGKDNFGGEKSLIYTIDAKEISAPDVSAPTSYTGASQIPIYSVGENEECKVVWKYKKIGESDSAFVVLDVNSNNFVNAGEYKLEVSGIGNYKGEKSAVYLINRISLPSLSVSKKNYIYNYEKTNVIISGNIAGSNVDVIITKKYADINNLTAESWQIYKDGEELDAGVYYMRAVVSTSTNYNETVSNLSTFEIYQDDLPSLPTLVTKTYNGQSQQVGEIDLYKLGKKLEYGKDYYIVWEYEGFEYELNSDPSKNFVNAGKYVAYLYGYTNGNYKVADTTIADRKFIINKASLDEFDVLNVNYDYSEEPVGFEIFKFKIMNSAYEIKVENGELVCSKGGTVKVYYNATTSVIGASGWVEYTEDTVLEAGEYYYYVQIVDNINYRDKTSNLVAVLKVNEVE